MEDPSKLPLLSPNIVVFLPLPSTSPLPLLYLLSSLPLVFPSFREELISWFVRLQLSDYEVMFHESLETAWLDKVDRRYAWLRRMLMNYEEESLSIFPPEWGMEERMCMQFCQSTRFVGTTITGSYGRNISLSLSLSLSLSPSLPSAHRDGLSKLMKSRAADLEVNMLLYAIQKTTSFEKLLAQRFINSKYMEVVGTFLTIIRWRGRGGLSSGSFFFCVYSCTLLRFKSKLIQAKRGRSQMTMIRRRCVHDDNYSFQA